MSMRAQTAVAPLEAEARGPRSTGSWRAVIADGRAKVGLALIATVLAIAFLGPLFASHEPGAIVGRPLSAPTAGSPLGTDYLGHDVLSRVLHGGRTVVWMPVAATVLGMILGTTVGLLAGYMRNRTDDVVVWTSDLLMAFPSIVFVLLFLSVLGRNPWLIVALVALTWLPIMARMARAVTLEAVEDEFVQAAEVIGTPRRVILFREILPNVLTPLLTQAGVLLTWSIGLIAGLSFLGFGVQPPTADWGLMINENFGGLTVQPWSVAAPMLCIVAFTLGTNLLAEGAARSIAGVDAGGSER